MLPNIQIIESVHLTVTVEKTVKRTWRERMFTWPWKPWEDTKTIQVQEPDPKFYVMTQHGSRTIVCHPARAAQLRDELGKQNLAHQLVATSLQGGLTR
jgi:hypothetical protein